MNIYSPDIHREQPRSQNTCWCSVTIVHPTRVDVWQSLASQAPVKTSFHRSPRAEPRASNMTAVTEPALRIVAPCSP